MRLASLARSPGGWTSTSGNDWGNPLQAACSSVGWSYVSLSIGWTGEISGSQGSETGREPRARRASSRAPCGSAPSWCAVTANASAASRRALVERSDAFGLGSATNDPCRPRVTITPANEPADRQPALHQREDGREPPEPHVHQARSVVAGSCHRIRLRARPHRIVGRQVVESPELATSMGPCRSSGGVSRRPFLR